VLPITKVSLSVAKDKKRNNKKIKKNKKHFFRKIKSLNFVFIMINTFKASLTFTNKV